MSVISMKQLLEAGVHFGHLTLLAEHPYVLERADISTIKSHYFVSLL